MTAVSSGKLHSGMRPWQLNISLCLSIGYSHFFSQNPNGKLCSDIGLHLKTIEKQKSFTKKICACLKMYYMCTVDRTEPGLYWWMSANNWRPPLGEKLSKIVIARINNLDHPKLWSLSTSDTYKHFFNIAVLLKMQYCTVQETASGKLHISRQRLLCFLLVVKLQPPTLHFRTSSTVLQKIRAQLCAHS